MRLRYKRSEQFVVSPVKCCECKKYTIGFVWRMTKSTGVIIRMRSHQYLCKTCAPMNYQSAAYFLNAAALAGVIANKVIRDEEKQVTKSLKTKLRIAQEDKRKFRGKKCPCGSGRKYKNCGRLGKCNG